MFEAEGPSMVNGHSQPASALIDESSSLLMDGDSPSRPQATPPATSGLDELNGLLMDDGFLGGPAPSAAPMSPPAGSPMGLDDMLGFGAAVPSPPSVGGLGIDDLLSGLGALVLWR